MTISKVTEELLKALEAGNYNAAPRRLRQGSPNLGYDPDWTEHEWDVWYTNFTGDVGYSPYPPTVFYGDEKPRTTEEIAEIHLLRKKFTDRE